MNVKHLNMNELEEGINYIVQTPDDKGPVRMIVSRPETGIRKILNSASLDTIKGLIGDNWKDRGSSGTPKKSANPETQITIMNSRVIDLIAHSSDRWKLAGDQLFIEMDISRNNIPPGSQLKIGSAVIEVSEKPHTGCQKFSERFGLHALIFVSTPLGLELCFRGINARVLKSGIVTVGDIVNKL
jgi:MOSC domain-containing protein YiiM